MSNTVEPIRDVKKIEAMKAYLKGKSLRNYCLYVVGINSALRITDLLGLCINDVLTEKGKMKDRISLIEKKTGKKKDFPISANARKAIEEFLKSRGKYELEEPLFPSRKGGNFLNRQQAHKILSSAAKAVGINEAISTHSLRKTFAFHAFKSGLDITRIMYLLNHSSPAVSLRYIGITKQELDDVYLNLNL